MSSIVQLSKRNMIVGSLIVGACAFLCVAIGAHAQYNTFDSDSNSDSEGGPILSQSELGRLVRNSAKAQANQNSRLRQNQQAQQMAAASRNLYNRPQPLQFAPTQNRRQYGSSEALNGFGPVMGAPSNSRGANSEVNDDDEGGSSLGPNFGSNFDNNDDDGEGSSANGDGQAINLNQAASGYPSQGEYSGDAGAAASFGFGGSGYGPSSDGSEFGPSDGGFGSEATRAKSASSPYGARGYGADEDAGAPLYGPNSAVNSGDGDDEGRSGYSPDGQGDNDNDDE